MKSERSEVDRGGQARHLAARAAEAGEAVAQSDRHDVHLGAGHLSFDHVAVAHVHRHVFVATRAVEQEVPGLDRVEGHAHGVGYWAPE